jgi:hypothetical protein
VFRGARPQTDLAGLPGIEFGAFEPSPSLFQTAQVEIDGSSFGRVRTGYGQRPVVQKFGFIETPAALVPETKVIEGHGDSGMLGSVGFFGRQQRNLQEFLGSAIAI